MISLLLICARLCLNDFNSVAINSGYLKLFSRQLVEITTTICSVELSKSDCLICMTAEIIAQWILRFASVFSGINLTNLIKLALIIIWYLGSNCDFPRKKKRVWGEVQPYGTRYVRFVLMITRCLRSSPCFEVLVRRHYVYSSATTSIQLLKLSISLFLTHFKVFARAQPYQEYSSEEWNCKIGEVRPNEANARERKRYLIFFLFFLNNISNNNTCFFILLTVMVTFTHHLYICVLFKIFVAIVICEALCDRKQNIYKKSRLQILL